MSWWGRQVMGRVKGETWRVKGVGRCYCLITYQELRNKGNGWSWSVVLNVLQVTNPFESLTLPTPAAMAPHSSTLAWKILWMEEPGGLQSMGSLRVQHDWATSLSLFTFMHWRRKWQPTPVFLPGESQGRGSLVGCRLRGHTESGTTEAT